MKVTRLIDLPVWLTQEEPEVNIFSAKRNGKWESFSRKYYAEISDLLSLGMMHLGIKKGDKVASVVHNNMPEWNFIDMGIMQLGAIHVPIYPTISRDEFFYILKHSESKVIFVSNEELFQKVNEIIVTEKLDVLIYSFEKIQNVAFWHEIADNAQKNASQNDKLALQTAKDSVLPSDISAIIYTSGTTGTPKGVMLSHNNIVTNVSDDKNLTTFKKGDKAVSFLPLCHVLEKSGSYLYQYHKVQVYYTESITSIAENMREVNPDFFISVPRLLEKIYDRIIATAKNLPLHKKTIFFWALNIGLQFDYEKLKDPIYSFKLKLARKLVFSKWREAMGGKVRWVVSGGAALQERLERVFRAAEINVQNGYGLTETSPIVTANRFLPPPFRFGSVGIPMTNVSVKIAEDGEILVKGPNVMLGYYKAPELTAQAIDTDGWFHTGDIGRIDADNFLFITDRKKELFKTSGGKYVAPQVIENKFKESDFIEQILVVGEGKAFVSAIIFPNYTYLHNWCAHKKINYSSEKKMIEMPEIIERFQREIDLFNENFGQIEKIKKFVLTEKEWTPENGFLSPTLKVKRRKLCEAYRKEVEAFYSKD